jgi:hypothetical protein
MGKPGGLASTAKRKTEDKQGRRKMAGGDSVQESNHPPSSRQAGNS